MNEQTFVAVYDTAVRADNAVRDLKAANVPAEAISQHGKDGSSYGSSTMSQPVRDRGFWASLFGTEPERDTEVYNNSINEGATVVSVRVVGASADTISAILERNDPIDFNPLPTGQDSRPALEGSRDTSGAQGLQNRSMGAETLKLSEETLSVGKRKVDGDTTRIHRYVVETPVEQNVTLRSDKVVLDRRPVTDEGRPGTVDFTDKTIEMKEFREEAVIAKNVRVKEEVSLRREGTDRVETVKDTVRREDVKVEQVPGKTTGSRLDTDRSNMDRRDLEDEEARVANSQPRGPKF